MVSDVVREKSVVVPWGVIACFGIGLVCLGLLSLMLWKVSGMPTEYRYAQAWVPNGTEETEHWDTQGVPGILISFAEYQRYEGEFTHRGMVLGRYDLSIDRNIYYTPQNGIPRENGVTRIQYFGMHDGVLFRTYIYPPSVRRPDGFLYWETSLSMDSKGMLTHTYSPWRALFAYSALLLLLGVLASISILASAFNTNRQWLWTGRTIRLR